MRFYFRTKEGDVFYSDEISLVVLKFMQDTSCEVFSNQKVYTHGLGGDVPDEEWLMLVLKAKPLNNNVN